MEQQAGTELMPLMKQGDEYLIDGRLLHQTLKVGRAFRHWIVERIAEYNFEENKDYFKAAGTKGGQHPSGGGSNRIDYSLTTDMAKELALVQNNETGRKFRRYLIAKEKEARAMLQLGMGATIDFLKGIPTECINGTYIYLYAEILRRFGYHPMSSGSQRKERYPNHFIKLGNKLYITKAYAEHLYRLSVVRKSRAVVKTMQPLLALNFGAPLELK